MRSPVKRNYLHFVGAIVSTCMVVCGAFVSPSLPGNVASMRVDFAKESLRNQVLVLLAEKKRRRRKSSPNNEQTPDVQRDFDAESSDALPEFELDDESEADSNPKPSKSVPTNPDEITPSMMGSSDQPVRSIKDLISDRDLESKFEFEEAEDASLPDLVELSKLSNASNGVPAGNKRARQAERKAAAIAAQGSEEQEGFVFPKLPFLSDDEGKAEPLKLLEGGSWAGIILLVTWEIYLNSPFFDRAAPLAPVVFENFLL